MMIDVLGTIFGLLGVLGIGFTVEKIPIKLKPLTWIKNFFIGDLRCEIENCNSNYKKLEKKIDTHEVDRIKQEILSFRILVLTPNIKLKALDFDHIFQLYDKYHSMGGNSVVDIAMEEIKIVYKEFMR